MYELSRRSHAMTCRPQCATQLHEGADDCFVFGVASRIVSCLLVVAVAAPLVTSLPDWLMATSIGCTWGALVLAGLSCSWTSHRASSGVYVLAVALLSQASMRVLTDFGHNSCWMLVCLLIMCGWATGLALTPWHANQRRPAPLSCRSGAKVRPVRCTIWDIICLTTMVAGISWYGPRVETPLDLICQSAPTFVGGALTSCMAIQWAWRDCWSITRLCCLLLAVPISFGLCLIYAPIGYDPRELAAWLIAGPASVMAAQGLTVLAGLSAARIDTSSCATRLLASALPSEGLPLSNQSSFH